MSCDCSFKDRFYLREHLFIDRALSLTHTLSLFICLYIYLSLSHTLSHCLYVLYISLSHTHYHCLNVYIYISLSDSLSLSIYISLSSQNQKLEEKRRHKTILYYFHYIKSPLLSLSRVLKEQKKRTLNSQCMVADFGALERR